MVGPDASGRINDNLLDLLGRRFCDFLDLHSTLRGRHDQKPRRLPVQQHAHVEFAGDVAALFNVEPLNFLAVRAGLLGDQNVVQHLGGVLADLVDCLDDTHAALAVWFVLEPPGTPATGMDL